MFGHTTLTSTRCRRRRLQGLDAGAVQSTTGGRIARAHRNLQFSVAVRSSPDTPGHSYTSVGTVIPGPMSTNTRLPVHAPTQRRRLFSYTIQTHDALVQ